MVEKHPSTSQLRARWSANAQNAAVKWILNGCGEEPPVDRLAIAGLHYWDCRGLDVGEALAHVDLTGIDFSHGSGNAFLTRVGNCRFLGCKLWGFNRAEWRECDFSKANFRGSSISGARFINCVLDGANFQRVFAGESPDWSETQFLNSSLIGAKFHQASLEPTFFYDCNLGKAKFGGIASEPMLRGVHFIRCRIADSEIDWGGA